MEKLLQAEVMSVEAATSEGYDKVATSGGYDAVVTSGGYDTVATSGGYYTVSRVEVMTRLSLAEVTI